MIKLYLKLDQQHFWKMNTIILYQQLLLFQYTLSYTYFKSIIHIFQNDFCLYYVRRDVLLTVVMTKNNYYPDTCQGGVMEHSYSISNTAQYSIIG